MDAEATAIVEWAISSGCAETVATMTGWSFVGTMTQANDFRFKGLAKSVNHFNAITHGPYVSGEYQVVRKPSVLARSGGAGQAGRSQGRPIAPAQVAVKKLEDMSAKISAVEAQVIISVKGVLGSGV